jgi:thiamine pyrophosphate-dependent acetolactate synthase large subunit-like protein
MIDRIDRRDVVRTLLENRGLDDRRDLLVVSGLGGTSWDVAAAGGHDLDFTLWGGMGTAAMTGLGLALAQPERPVLVITGDGEMLMGLGSLATIAVQRVNNLAIAVLDNGRYGETGEQSTHTAEGVDLCGMARAAGIGDVRRIETMEGVAALRQATLARSGTVYAQVMIETGSPPMALPPRDGPWLKSRFRRALLGTGEG